MLIEAPGRWDEACFAVPAVRALIASGISVGILCPEWQKSFWRTIGGLQIVSYTEPSKARALALELSGKWEASLAWQPGLAAEAFSKAGIPRRIGPQDPAMKKFLTHPVNIKTDPLAHRVQFYLSILAEMGIPTDRPEFFNPAPHRIAQAGDTVLICPDSDFGANHEWPLERWQEIALALTKKGLQVTVANLASGRSLGKALAANLGDHTPLFEAADFSTELSLIAAYPFVIAADGSLPHLASHIGATCATLFGPNDPAWKRPLGKRHLLIRRHVECSPCLLSHCPMDLRCQNDLTTERVLEMLFPQG